MLVNQRDIEKGASLRDRLLDRGFDLITHCFLSEFPGKSRTLEMDETTLIIRAFPLPDSYTPDHVDLLFEITGYPVLPPAGVYIPATAPNRDQIAKHLNGHVMTRTPSYVLDRIPINSRKSVEQLAQQGWGSWLCLHYVQWSWRLNYHNLLRGDCLYKFIENVFAALSGGHK